MSTYTTHGGGLAGRQVGKAKKKKKRTALGSVLANEQLRLGVLISALLITSYIVFVVIEPPKEQLPELERYQQMLEARTANTGEQITYYGSIIEAQPGGELLISQKIQFVSAQDIFKIGISPIIPIARIGNKEGELIKHRFQVLHAALDGKRIQHTMTPLEDTTSMVFPVSQTTIQSGAHEYELRYKLAGATEQHGARTMLKLPAITPNWYIPLQKAVVTVQVPIGENFEEATVTGHIYDGERPHEPLQLKRDPLQRTVTLWPPRSLRPLEGIMIEASW